MEANACAGYDVIYLKVDHTLTVPLAGTMDLDTEGDLDIYEDLDIIGVPSVRVDAAAGYGERLFDVHPGVRVTMKSFELADGSPFGGDGGGLVRNTDSQLYLSGMVLRGGEALAVGWGGGAVLNDAGYVVLANSEVVDNEAEGTGYGGGGGLMNLVGGRADIINTTFSGNHGRGVGGPGGGAVWNEGDLTISDSDIVGNIGDGMGGGGGGGVYNSPIGTLTHVGGQVSYNTGLGGGGYGGGGIYNDGYMVLRKMMVAGNSGDGQGGPDAGGIANRGDLRLDLVDVEVNSALGASTSFQAGGGIFNDGVLSLAHSSVIENIAADGGGLYNGLGVADVSNTTFGWNVALNEGGGMFVNSGGVGIYNTTITRNFAAPGSAGLGIHNAGGNVELWHTILAENGYTAALGPAELDCGGSFTSLDFNTVGVLDGTCTMTALGSDLFGNLGSPFDPDLAGMSWTGTTWAFFPLAGGSSHDSGDTACMADDQRYLARPVTLCERGAIELP